MENNKIIFGITILVILTFAVLIYFSLNQPFYPSQFCWDKGYDFADYFKKEGKITCTTFYQEEIIKEEFKVIETFFGIKEVRK